LIQKQILNKSISTESENINVPNTPFRSVVKYKNFTDLYWRIIKITRNEVRAERKKWARDYNVDREQKFLEHFNVKEPVKSGKVVLPDDGDYQFHSTEIPLEGVPEGDYMILLSANPDFKIQNNNLAYSYTTISNLAYFHRNMDDGTTELYVTNRTSGEPVHGAKVQVFKNIYNSKSGEYELVKSNLLLSDINGFVKVPFQTDKKNYYSNNSFSADINYSNDYISTRAIDTYDYSYDYTGMIGQYQQYPKRSK